MPRKTKNADDKREDDAVTGNEGNGEASPAKKAKKTEKPAAAPREKHARGAKSDAMKKMQEEGDDGEPPKKKAASSGGGKGRGRPKGAGKGRGRPKKNAATKVDSAAESEEGEAEGAE